MNKIYKAFDSIKFDEKIKKSVYQKLNQRKLKKHHIKIKYIQLCAFTLACLIILMIITTDDSQINRLNEYEVDLLTTTEFNNDSFIYEGNIYNFDADADVLEYTVGNKIGILNQINSIDELKQDFDSYNHDRAIVYSSSNEMVLIVKVSNKMLIYRKII